MFGLERKTAIAAIILIALAIVLALFGWQQWQSARNAGREMRVATGQASASIANGRDAVATVGAAQTRETTTDQVTRENADAIRSAPGAAAPVDPRVRDAGLAGLCRRAAYRGDPKCLRFATAR